MEISFKIHSPWSIGRKAAETGQVNNFSSRSGILDPHSFVMIGGMGRTPQHEDEAGQFLKEVQDIKGTVVPSNTELGIEAMTNAM
ncbi:hypothetical protein HFO38_06575 [Rhizobium leguminosarum]|uniref:hypothetical protein n=1 Tax=Rhizobium leguminosarum TaxID=384 RepID=UPI001C949792|nr:hypothetical protein [Rhizobium leguminosarum]MBY5702394.1 hypothetical protein [Rhizobium leguminosarum]